MVNTLVGTIQDTGGLKDVRSDVDQAFRFFNETLKVKQHSTIVKARDISGNSLIWGNTSKAWGSPYEWAAVITNAFILGNSAAGILGSSNFRWTFAGSDQIQTTLISYNENVTIINATLNIESTQITNGSNLTYYLSADDGTNFEQVTLGTQHVFTNTGKKLKLKIVASGSAQIDVDDSDDYSYPVEVRVNQ